MKICFVRKEYNENENILCKCMKKGSKDFCTEFIEQEPKTITMDSDIYIIFGLYIASSANIYNRLMEAGKHIIYVDKGYMRKLGAMQFWRVAIDSFQLSDEILNREYSEDRMWAFGDNPMAITKPRRSNRIVFAGASQKYCGFFKQGEASAYAESVLEELGKYTKKDLVYRPKPKAAVKKERKIKYETETEKAFNDSMMDCACLVSYGSNALVEAQMFGIPTLTLGDHPIRNISRTKLEEINDVRSVTKEEKLKIFKALSWHQWTMDEFRDGAFWEFAMGEL